MATVAGLFENRDQAIRAAEALKTAGLRGEDLSIVMRDRREAADVAEAAGAGDATAAGVVGGGILGGLAGWLVGIGALAIPGIGPIVAAGPLVAALTGGAIGAMTGGLLGALVDAGVPEEEAKVYQTGVERGGILMTVSAPEGREAEVRRIMEANGMRDAAYHRDLLANNPNYEYGQDAGADKTVGGSLAAGAAGAAIGTAVAGPVGTIVGGAIGGAAGAGAGATMDTAEKRQAGEREPHDADETTKGALAGGTTGAVIGTAVAGPVGTAVGAAIGGTVGAAGGSANDYAEAEGDFRQHYNSSAYRDRYTWDQASPAYRYGWDNYNQGQTWDQARTNLQQNWRGQGAWNDYEPMVREGYERRHGWRGQGGAGMTGTTGMGSVGTGSMGDQGYHGQGGTTSSSSASGMGGTQSNPATYDPERKWNRDNEG